MIFLVDGQDRSRHGNLVDAMYRIRAKVFGERLGWDVVVEDGREIDPFDAINPLYLISVNEWTGQVEGSLRLLPTTGPNMPRNVFPVLCRAATSSRALRSGRARDFPSIPTCPTSGSAMA